MSGENVQQSHGMPCRARGPSDTLEQDPPKRVRGLSTLNQDLLRVVLTALGQGNHLLVSICREWRALYLELFPDMVTFKSNGVSGSIDVFLYCYRAFPCDSTAHQRALGFQFDWHLFAAASGNIALLEYMYAEIPDIYWDSASIYRDMDRNNIVRSHYSQSVSLMSQWNMYSRIRSREELGQLLPGKYDVCSVAVRHGHQHVIEWALSKGMDLGSRTLLSAVDFGSQDLVQYLLAKDCPLSPGVFVVLAQKGDLDLLQLVRRESVARGFLNFGSWMSGANGLDRIICSTAREYKHLHILEWAIDAGCRHE